MYIKGRRDCGSSLSKSCSENLGEEKPQTAGTNEAEATDTSNEDSCAFEQTVDSEVTESMKDCEGDGGRGDGGEEETSVMKDDSHPGST